MISLVQNGRPTARLVCFDRTMFLFLIETPIELFRSVDWISFTDIYLFEANPFFTTALILAKEENDELRIKVKNLPLYRYRC